MSVESIAAPSDLNPYVGPRPFENTFQDIARFYGRTRETRDMLALMAAQQTVLFYGKSGTGKTSLLNAALLPELKAKGYDLLPTARVQGMLSTDVDLPKLRNIYVYNAILSMLRDEDDASGLSQIAFMDYLNSYPHLTRDDGSIAPRILIFDQFEELFTAYPGHWPDRNDFFDQVDDALQNDPALRVLFVMREDYIAELDSDTFTSILPSLITTRFRLESLQPDQALAAVVRPLKYTRREFAAGAAEKLVAELLSIPHSKGQGNAVSEQYAEPVILQVVCRRLWDALPKSTKVIGITEVETHAKVGNALRFYYEECLGSTIDTVLRKQIEAAITEKFDTADEQVRLERTIRDWFEQALITSEDTRSKVHQGAETTGGLQNSIITIFEDRHHIIRGENTGKDRWYELVHDRFIEPIQQSNADWKLAHERQRVGEERVLRQKVEKRYTGSFSGSVFVSYARRDNDFVRRMIEALNNENVDVWVDWADISYSVEWWAEIQNGIARSDNFLLVLSMASLQSPMCHGELNYARTHNKRIIPLEYSSIDMQLVYAELAGQDWAGENFEMIRDNLEFLQTLNWLRIRENDFENGLNDLLLTLATDQAYTRMHTQLLSRAREWEDRHRDPSFLLSGTALRDAQDWWIQSQQRVPAPTTLHHTYILASSRLQEKRDSRMRNIFVLNLILLIVMVISYVLLINFSSSIIGEDLELEITALNESLSTSQASELHLVETLTSIQTQTSATMEAQTPPVP